MATPKPWVDSPLAMIPTPMFVTKKTDMFTIGASHMCQMHNSIFRGYNSIYQQAAHIKDGDKASFIGYCLTWYKFVKTHADDEEANLFPLVEQFLEDKNVWADTHKEHDAFLPAIAEFHNYLTSLKSPAEFSGSDLHIIMDTFQGPFETHFRSEISTIARLAEHSRTPEEGTPEEKKAADIFEAWGRNTVIKAGLTDVLPIFLFNLDRDYEDGLWAAWPPIPPPIKWALVNVGGWLHSGWWRFASCDSSGQRRELYALKA